MTPTDFPTFFQALWGYPPFDWQTRLLERVIERGWPSTLDLPTGAGKTAALDVAVFALALDAARPFTERRQARRIVLVVDRRVVVDQAFERACSIAKKLDDAKEGILAKVAEALRTLSGNPDGLPVLPAILRGGMPRESEWAKSPSQPVILTSTVDQVGSRLLFRGYGVSERMRSVHAGLLGCDTLLLLDEVHLARPFEETLTAATKWYAQGEAASLSRPLQFVRMSATVTESLDEPFALAQADRDNSELVARLTAKKVAVLRVVKTPRDARKASDTLSKAATREAERLCKGNARAIAVIVNRVETARQIAQAAEKGLGPEWAVYLLTGRMRPLDRFDKQAAVLEHVRSGRKRSTESTKILVVSTQALEAGADFDFDALITECASLDSLRQRFGRLDRMGKLGQTDAVILAGSSSVDEKAEPDPIYGAALRGTWDFLSARASQSPEHDATVIDFGIDEMNALLAPLAQKEKQALSAPRQIAPILTSSHLDRWVQTSPAPHADPEVSPYLHGIGRGSPEVQVVWRADIDAPLLKAEMLPRLREMLDLVRPSSLEALSVPLWAVAQWLKAVHDRSTGNTPEESADSVLLSDVEGAKAGEGDVATLAPALIWRGGEVNLVSAASELRPGVTLVVPSAYGGLDERFFSWDPESKAAVRDRGDEAQLLQKGRAVLRWHPAVLRSWSPVVASKVAALIKSQEFKDEVDERGEAAERDAFHEWRTLAIADADTPTWARAALRHLARGGTTQRITLKAADGEVTWRAQVKEVPVHRSVLRELFNIPELRDAPLGRDDPGEAATEEDEGSFLGSPISLTRHLEGVRDFAERFGRALGLPGEITSDLALAGFIHDLGKADPRFQLLLHGGDTVKEASARELLAKSAVPATDRVARERARERAGYPQGMRHELLSVALAERSASLRKQANDWELVLHLVGSHHGWCRPSGPPVLDPAPRDVSLEFQGETLTSSSQHGLERFDSGVAERFWRLVAKYGYWGLAWLEAVLRLADHRESEREAPKGDRNA